MVQAALRNGDSGPGDWPWEANARVAIAALQLERAPDCIAHALSTMEGSASPAGRSVQNAASFSARGRDSARDRSRSDQDVNAIDQVERQLHAVTQAFAAAGGRRGCSPVWTPFLPR